MFDLSNGDLMAYRWCGYLHTDLSIKTGFIGPLLRDGFDSGNRSFKDGLRFDIDGVLSARSALEGNSAGTQHGFRIPYSPYVRLLYVAPRPIAEVAGVGGSMGSCRWQFSSDFGNLGSVLPYRCLIVSVEFCSGGDSPFVFASQSAILGKRMEAPKVKLQSSRR